MLDRIKNLITGKTPEEAEIFSKVLTIINDHEKSFENKDITSGVTEKPNFSNFENYLISESNKNAMRFISYEDSIIYEKRENSITQMGSKKKLKRNLQDLEKKCLEIKGLISQASAPIIENPYSEITQNDEKEAQANIPA